MRAVRRITRTVPVTIALFGLAACTGPESATTSPVTASIVASATAGESPFWEGTANFAGTGALPLPIQVRLYPLQRLSNRVLLTVDLRSAVSTPAFSPFCAGDSCGDLSGISLIDTTSRMRFGPLRSGETGPMMTSSTRGLALKAGMTYRFGAIFADPGTDAMTVDLQQGGVAVQVPIRAGFPRSNLISSQPPGTGAWNPAAVKVGTLVTAPAPAVIGRFQANRHRLVSKIVGGRVNDAPGLIAISADRLFVSRSPTLAPGAPGLIKQAADILTAKADPRGPVSVVAYGDVLGSTALTRSRAQAAGRALAGLLRPFTLRPRGAGSSLPVAAGTTSMRQDSPVGRALNRRIEVSYAGLEGSDVPQSGTTAAPTRSVVTPTSGSPSSGTSPYLRPALPLAVSSPTGPAQPKGPGAPGSPAVPSIPASPVQPARLASPAMTPTVTVTPTVMVTPSMTPVASSAASSGDGVAMLIKVGPAQLEPGSRARFTAGITSVQLDGGMTVVSLLVRSDAAANPVGAFSTQGGRRTNLGAFHLIDRTTGQVFIPAYDADNPDRVTGTFTHRLNAGTSYRYTFFTTALPVSVTSVDVALAGMGTAASTPVVMAGARG